MDVRFPLAAINSGMGGWRAVIGGQCALDNARSGSARVAGPFASTTLTSWAARVRANAHAPPGWAARRSRETAPTRSRMRTRVTFSPSAPESRRDIARAFSIRSSSWRLAVRIRHKIDHLGGVKTLPALPDGGQQPVNDGERRAQLVRERAE